MRASIIAAAPFLGAAIAQSSSSSSVNDWHTTIVSIATNGSTYGSTYTYQYDNPATSLLTQTNSNGIITAQPPSVINTNPTAAATIPAGLPTGVTSIGLNISGSVTYFSISVGSSTTVALGGGASVESGTVVASATETGGSSSPSSGSGSSESGSGSGGSESGGSGSGSSGQTGTSTHDSSSTRSGSGSTTSSTGNAGNNLKAVGAGVAGLGALFAALI